MANAIGVTQQRDSLFDPVGKSCQHIVVGVAPSINTVEHMAGRLERFIEKLLRTVHARGHAHAIGHVDPGIQPRCVGAASVGDRMQFQMARAAIGGGEGNRHGGEIAIAEGAGSIRFEPRCVTAGQLA